MSEALEGLVKIFGSVGTMVTGGWGFVGKIEKRRSQIEDITNQGGELGAWFVASYVFWQYLYGVLLIGSGLAGLALLVGGLAKILNPPVGFKYLTPFFDSSVFLVLALAILILLVARFNVLSWIFMLPYLLIPAKVLPLKQSAGWFNVLQFSSPLAEPKPLFFNPQGISNVADIAISQLERNGVTSQQFAAKPVGLSLDQLANVALFGCLLEKEHSIRADWPRRNWQPFYAALAASESNGRKLVSPDCLVGLTPDSDFYGELIREINSRLPATEPPIPDSAAARDDLTNTVNILLKKYKGSARNLAFNWRNKKPNMRLAFNRAQSFKPMDASSMVPQFLKLAMRWGTWPNVQPGSFIYPYASRIALLLFERHALVTLPNVKNLAFKKSGQLAAYRETMCRIVEKTDEMLSASNKPQHRKILTDYPTEWELASAIDFVLWSHSFDLHKNKMFKEWKLDESGLLARKAGGGGASEETKNEPSASTED